MNWRSHPASSRGVLALGVDVFGCFHELVTTSLAPVGLRRPASARGGDPVAHLEGVLKMHVLGDDWFISWGNEWSSPLLGP
jgi:hypothetical protein